MKNIIVLFIVMATLHFGCAQETLKRRAYWGVSYEEKDGSVVVSKVNEDFAFGLSDIRPGDIIIGVDDTEIKTRGDFRNQLRGRFFDDELQVILIRDGNQISQTVKATPYPFEKAEGLTFEYGELNTSSRDLLRTIVSKPEGNTSKLPAILFVQWLSCDHVEAQPTFMDGNVRLIHDLSKAGYLVMRTDKPGVGDSQGKPCNEYGFDYELEVHKEALQALKKREDIDPNNIVIMGSSMGGAMAPMVAQGQNVKGLIVTGCYYKTWYEHMLEIERRISFLDGDSPSTTYNKMRDWAQFYNLYLNEGMSPGEVLSKHPEFKYLWSGNPDSQYGRNYKFYIEANNHNVPDYWSNVNAPVLVIYGEYDWIMSRKDHMMIAEAANRRKEGLGTYLEIEKMDHGLNIYESQEQAYSSFSPVYDNRLTAEVLKWLSNL